MIDSKAVVGKAILLLIALVLFVPNYKVHAFYGHNFNTTLRVGLIDRFNNRASINVNNSAIFYGQSFLQSHSGGFTVRPYGNNIAIYDGSNRLRIIEPHVQIRDGQGDMTLLDGVPFRGAIEFARLGSGITAVNVISMEEYLFSVVPSEMPATWHLEALKAQAVAARTYAMLMLSRGNSHVGFDVCNGVCCQVYRGAEWENDRSTYAVLATAGLAMFFNGELIEAVYSASSGGFTENSENVWVEARPYLRSVSDPFEFEPVVWTRNFTMSQISQLLGRQATGVSIGGHHPSGRVESLIIHYQGGSRVLQREEIRTFFSPTADGSLMSRNFTIGEVVPMPLPPPMPTDDTIVVYDGTLTHRLQPQGLYGIGAQGVVLMKSITTTEGTVPQTQGFTAAPTPQPSGVVHTGYNITLHGRGFGHGVGMSQRGAEGMAQRGHTFREILTHFYSGITIH